MRGAVVVVVVGVGDVVVVVVLEVVVDVGVVGTALQMARATGVEVGTVVPADGVCFTTAPRVLGVQEVVVVEVTCENPCCVSVEVAPARLLPLTLGTGAWQGPLDTVSATGEAFATWVPVGGVDPDTSPFPKELEHAEPTLPVVSVEEANAPLACVGESPTTLGTPTVELDLGTVRSTVDPRGTSCPLPGVWEITVVAGLLLDTNVTLDLRRVFSSTASALASEEPTTVGTTTFWTGAGPELTVSTTLSPFFTLAVAFGVLSSTVPLASALVLSTDGSTTSPFSWRTVVAVATGWWTTLGMAKLLLPSSDTKK